MPAASKEEYELLVKQAEALTAGEDDWIANVANVSALLFHALKEVNFAGVYRFEKGELILGPFQGQPACVHIAMGQGVCGTAAKEEASQIVPDVHAFPGHIACDSASNSEIVVPIRAEGRVVGVLDIDSPLVGRFTEEDRTGLEEFVRILEAEIW